MLTLAPLARGELILLADNFMSNLLAQFGDLKFKKIQKRIQSGCAEFDLNEFGFGNYSPR